MKATHDDVKRAINTILKKDDIAIWLNEPNHYLKDKTPKICLKEGKYNLVIDALWMADNNTGPVS